MKLASTAEFALVQAIARALEAMLAPVELRDGAKDMSVPQIALNTALDVDAEMLGVEYTFQLEINWQPNISERIQIELIFGKFDNTVQTFHLRLVHLNGNEPMFTACDEAFEYAYSDDVQTNTTANALAFIFYRFLLDTAAFDPKLVTALIGK